MSLKEGFYTDKQIKKVKDYSINLYGESLNEFDLCKRLNMDSNIKPMVEPLCFNPIDNRVVLGSFLGGLIIKDRNHLINQLMYQYPNTDIIKLIDRIDGFYSSLKEDFIIIDIMGGF
jgi:hypothetical protein